jgi:hypothetical protein
MAQPNENINYPLWYYQHEPKETIILDESIYITIKKQTDHRTDAYYR